MQSLPVLENDSTASGHGGSSVPSSVLMAPQQTQYLLSCISHFKLHTVYLDVVEVNTKMERIVISLILVRSESFDKGECCGSE